MSNEDTWEDCWRVLSSSLMFLGSHNTRKKVEHFLSGGVFEKLMPRFMPLDINQKQVVERVSSSTTFRKKKVMAVAMVFELPPYFMLFLPVSPPIVTDGSLELLAWHRFDFHLHSPCDVRSCGTNTPCTRLLEGENEKSPCCRQGKI